MNLAISVMNLYKQHHALATYQYQATEVLKVIFILFIRLNFFDWDANESAE